MNAVVETLDELADDPPVCVAVHFHVGWLCDPQVIGVLRTGCAGVDRCIRVGIRAISSSKLRGGSCHGSQSTARSDRRPRGA